MCKESSAKYYQNNKEGLQKKAHDIKDIKDGKENKQQYGRQWYTNLPEDEKQKVVEYRKNIIKREITPYYN